MFEKRDSAGHGKVIGSVITVMVLLTAVNMGFTYHMVGKKDMPVVGNTSTNIDVAGQVIEKYLGEQYKMYGGKENYEKVALMQAAQIDQQFGSMSLEEVKKMLADQKTAAETQAKAQKIGNKVQELGEKDIVGAEYKKGPENATITVYEHSDFNCGYCKKLHDSGVADKLLAEYKDLNFAQKNRPVIGGENSMMKATAAMCVGELGGAELYYKAQDALYSNREKSDVISALVKLGLDEAALTTCIDSGKYSEALKSIIDEGNNFGISGTPGSVIVNNKTKKFKIVKGAAPYESFKAAVDELLVK